eukprot:TRINITY_DN14091_c0_g1_i1.p1 TRINITY_DN14091_c0_g1~~TRINITY_DN14091_c0_g1_i1.p1  ORF type:complete len:446 (+),score=68.71 TRINITY_DN14091_c0_g1_i1:128-1339(+)
MLVGCFRKELALFLKTDFLDNDSACRRKMFCFRRNYFEVPNLKSQVEDTFSDVINLLSERLHQIYLAENNVSREHQSEISFIIQRHHAADASALVAKDALKSFLPSLSEQKGFLKLNFPAAWIQFGEKPVHRELQSFKMVREALTRWWTDDVRGWVSAAEQETIGVSLSRILFNGQDDHLELKVSGLGKTCHFVVPEEAELEELAELVDEKMLAKTCEEKGLEDTYFGSWLIKIVDGVRMDRARTVQDEVAAFQVAHPNAPQDKLDDIKLFQDGRHNLQYLKRLLDLKVECGMIPDVDARRLRQEFKKCTPYARFASCNDELECPGGLEEYLQNTKVSVLPGPEELPLLAHTNKSVRIELEWIKLWEPPYKIEVVARVPRDIKRPYALCRHTKRQRLCDSDFS